ncbi:DUF1295-domain-containing protein [Suillus clintonianus]|uniref:DUF1295-domain-containing protein n=1 Tax=Suillus clintonianus TaxID=1904413 RepID=UPI001B85E933|nr:DUF1295-domain-containing protein [Suillus clintonianus]KAG2140131.1 DUF1295-domain-containing protein [Suillus clintonianus]
MIFSRLTPVAVSAYALQAGLACIFVPKAEDRFYDLSGAAGFLSTTLVSIYYPYIRSQGKITHSTFLQLPRLAPRQALLSAALVIWSLRLGSFLAQRAIKAGGDSRFDEIKKDKIKFTGAWMAQATWIFVVGLPVYISNVLPASAHPRLHASDFISLALIAGSFALEVMADGQKSTWRREKQDNKHEDSFISKGVWGWSRHPNYVGELGFWTGMFGLAAFSGALPLSTAVATAASPLLTYVLLRHVSGVPPLERAADKKFGDDKKWQEYKR